MQVAKSRQRRYFDFQHRLASGEIRDVEVCAGPIVAGGRTLLFSVINDVTERKRVEERLHESEKRYRALFERAGDCIYIVDAEGERPGQIVSANPAAAEMHGYTVEEMLSLNIAELDTPESAKKLKARIERVLKGETVKEETTHRRKDGTVFPLEINARLLELGSHKYALAIDRDITDRREMDAAFKEIQGQQKALLDNIPDLAWLKDKESRFIALNQPFGKACGVAPEDLRGKTDLDIWPLELAERYRADDRDVMASGNQKRVEEALIDKDGNMTWIETIKTPIYNDVGENIGTAGIARDITERKHAEEALRLSEEQYRAVFDNAGIGINVVDRDGRLSHANTAFLNMLGYSEEELRKFTPPDITHPDDRELSKQYMDGIIAGDFDSFKLEKRYVRKNGSVIWGHLSVSTIRDAEGKPRSAVGVIADITDRKRAEGELVQAKHDWEETFNSITDAITVHDKDFNIIRFNKAAERMLGLPDSLIPKELKCYKCYHGKNSPPAECPSCRCLDTGEQAIFEIFEPHLNRHIEIRAIPRF